MPLIEESSYANPPVLQRGGHLQSIFPGLFRKVKGVDYQRERIETADDDFLDLDWVRRPGNRRLVIVSHGLEADSRAQYCMGTAKYFHQHGWDALAWNCRSCSGEMNRQFAANMEMFHVTNGYLGGMKEVFMEILQIQRQILTELVRRQ